MSDVVSPTVDIAAAVETRCLRVEWHLADGTAQTLNVPRPMETAHLEQVFLLDWFSAAAAAGRVVVVVADKYFRLEFIVILVELVIAAALKQRRVTSFPLYVATNLRVFAAAKEWAG